MNAKKRIRCIGALERLEIQLKSGAKNATINNKDVRILLSDKNIIRIKKEILILQVKLKI